MNIKYLIIVLWEVFPVIILCIIVVEEVVEGVSSFLDRTFYEMDII
jgi:hypothetical protein